MKCVDFTAKEVIANKLGAFNLEKMAKVSKREEDYLPGECFEMTSNPSFESLQRECSLWPI